MPLTPILPIKPTLPIRLTASLRCVHLRRSKQRVRLNNLDALNATFSTPQGIVVHFIWTCEWLTNEILGSSYLV